MFLVQLITLILFKSMPLRSLYFASFQNLYIYTPGAQEILNSMTLPRGVEESKLEMFEVEVQGDLVKCAKKFDQPWKMNKVKLSITRLVILHEHCYL